MIAAVGVIDKSCEINLVSWKLTLHVISWSNLFFYISCTLACAIK